MELSDCSTKQHLPINAHACVGLFCLLYRRGYITQSIVELAKRPSRNCCSGISVRGAFALEAIHTKHGEPVSLRSARTHSSARFRVSAPPVVRRHGCVGGSRDPSTRAVKKEQNKTLRHKRSRNSGPHLRTFRACRRQRPGETHPQPLSRLRFLGAEREKLSIDWPFGEERRHESGWGELSPRF